jgi:alginate O-acetyltransferase complex protein AlgI
MPIYIVDMPLNSFAFAIFFLTVVIFIRVSPLLWTKPLLLGASYIFYAHWDLRFLPLLVAATAIDYFAAFRIAPEAARSDANRRHWLIASIVTQLGMLWFFKYANFSLGIVNSVLSELGVSNCWRHIDIILPLGISFYTFKTLTYTIDIYRGQIQPTRCFFDYALHVGFFATLVAGPIERARNFLPQLITLRRASREQLLEGSHLIFWGFFKKVFVADNIARLVDHLFGTANPTGFGVLLGSYSFALQIFCDFSGYTDIARGCAKCLGIELSENFRQPYLAQSPSDFWQRWHITLSTWLRDYVFLPLGGAFKSLSKAYRNLAITMIIAGLWHGASWTFVLWGAYWTFLLVGHRILQPKMKRSGKLLTWRFPKSLRKGTKILVTSQLVCIGWLVFRSESLSQLWIMVSCLFCWKGSTEFSLLLPLAKFGGFYLLIEVTLLIARSESLRHLTRPVLLSRAIIYGLMFYCLAFYGSSTESFIYAQF